MGNKDEARVGPESVEAGLRAVFGDSVRAPAAGAVDDRYSVVGEIARGGVGIVLKSHDRELSRDVAVKVLPSIGQVNCRSTSVEARVGEAATTETSKAKTSRRTAMPRIPGLLEYGLAIHSDMSRSLALIDTGVLQPLVFQC